MRIALAAAAITIAGLSHAQTKSLMPGDTALILEPTWACIASVSKRLDAVMPDKTAFRNILLAAARTGECVEMGKGTRIIVEDVAVFDGTTSLRIEGTETVRLATTSVLSETARRTGNLYRK